MGRKLKVLVVDDSPTILGLFELVVLPPEDGQFELVGIALSPAEALPMIETRRPDVIVLDYEMPGQDGLTLLKQIKTLRSDTVVFLMSSHDEEAARLESEALASGALDYLPKPSSDDSAIALRHLMFNCLQRAGLVSDPGSRA